MRIRTLLLALAVLGLAPSHAQDRIYTPTQSAYLKGEVKRAQERFVEQAAAASGLPAAKLRQWVPTDGRDVPPKVAVIPAIERERGKPLTEDERARIRAADEERFAAIEKAKQEALKK